VWISPCLVKETGYAIPDSGKCLTEADGAAQYLRPFRIVKSFHESPASMNTVTSKPVPENLGKNLAKNICIVGAGAIGGFVGAKLAQAGRIIAIDTNPSKFDLARTFGATDCVNPKDFDKPIQLRGEPIDPLHLQLLLLLQRSGGLVVCLHDGSAFAAL
jgi:hypothetical protein